MKYTTILCLPILLLLNCTPKSAEKRFEQDNVFPKVQLLDELKKTVFLPALEMTFKKENNAIYAASLLFAWDEVKTAIDAPIAKIESSTLKEMDSSNSYQGVLNSDEYSSEAEIDGLTIKAKAFFKKNLPFELPLYEKDLNFLGKPVEAFGFYNYNDFTRILYYRTNNDFAIQFQPKDEEHEIILWMKRFPFSMEMKNEFTFLKEEISAFGKQRSESNRWKYDWEMEDEVTVPVIQFHLESNYESLIGTSFSTEDERKFDIVKAYQRTAFVLNRNGARVESEADLEVTEEAAEMEELPQPKKLIFDKPFMIFLKRKDQTYPYFGCFVANRELMIEK